MFVCVTKHEGKVDADSNRKNNSHLIKAVFNATRDFELLK